MPNARDRSPVIREGGAGQVRAFRSDGPRSRSAPAEDESAPLAPNREALHNPGPFAPDIRESDHRADKQEEKRKLWIHREPRHGRRTGAAPQPAARSIPRLKFWQQAGDGHGNML